MIAAAVFKARFTGAYPFSYDLTALVRWRHYSEELKPVERLLVAPGGSRSSEARYSFRGLQNQIEHLLTRLRARDLRVEECGVERPIMFPAVQVIMQMLVPAAQGKAGPTVAAHWRKVRLAPDMYQNSSGEVALTASAAPRALHCR